MPTINTESVKNGAASFPHDAADAMVTARQQVADTLKSHVQDLKNGHQRVVKTTRRTIRGQPLTAMGAAMGAGALIGAGLALIIAFRRKDYDPA